MRKYIYNVREVDDFGRISIPVGYRRLINVKSGDPFEINVDADKKQIILKKIEVEEEK